MPNQSNVHYHLAIDVGASSGRLVLGHVEDGKIVLEEMYRFENTQIDHDGHACWDIDGIYNEILQGLHACAEAGKIPETVGIDTWGVDFVLIDGAGNRVGDAVAYRDNRTQGMVDEVRKMIPPSRVYRDCGIQCQPFNTIYQFVALLREHPEQVQQARRFLMIPDYLNYRLTGVTCNEYTNATTTNMLNARTKDWDDELMAACGIPQRLFAKPVMPGNVIGTFTTDVARRVGFSAKVMLPATHDTGSAFLAVPAKDEDAVYLSSGTWSLLGVEHEGPVTTEAARLQNFTNEGGYQYRFRFLKNIMGLWIVQSIRRELNGVTYIKGDKISEHAIRKQGEPEIGFGDLIAAAEKESDFPSIFDVNDDRFLSPASMIDEVQGACRDTGQPVPETVGQIMQCVYHSLADCYATSIADLQALTGRTYTSMNIVGGGCQDGYLNQATANACGLPVYAGPVEGTSLGNLIVQFLSTGEFDSLQQARDAIRDSFDIKCIMPASK